MVDVLLPQEKSEATEAEALIHEAKQRARRRHFLLGVAAAMVTAAMGVGIVIGISGNNGVTSPPPPPPGFASGQLDQIIHAASTAAKSGTVTKALIYSTTRERAYKAGTGMDPVPANERVYVVVLEGHFVCWSCSVPLGAKAPSGKVITITFNPPGMGAGGTAFGVVNSPPGPGMGKPYTLELK